MTMSTLKTGEDLLSSSETPSQLVYSQEFSSLVQEVESQTPTSECAHAFDDDLEQHEKHLPYRHRRYCWRKFSFRQLMAIMAILFCLLALVMALITFLVANNVIAASKIEPTQILMHVGQQPVSSGKTRALTEVEPAHSLEYLQLYLSARIQNEAMLGGALLGTTLDVYATFPRHDEGLDEPEEVKILSMDIPDISVQGRANAVIDICGPAPELEHHLEEDVPTRPLGTQDLTFEASQADESLCRLTNLATHELETIQRFVAHIMIAEDIQMRIHAPHGVKLKARGIVLPFSFGFNKRFSVKGMHGAMSAVKLSAFDLSHSELNDLRFSSTATIDNPSIFGFKLLPMIMEVYTFKNKDSPVDCPEEIYVGTTETAESTLIRPRGQTQLMLWGEMNFQVRNVCVQNFIQRYLQGESNDVLAKLTSDGSSSSYLNAILRSTILYAKLSDGYDKALFRQVSISAMDMKINRQSNASFHLAQVLDVHLNSPIGHSKLETKEISKIHVKMTHRGQEMGTLTGKGVIDQSGSPSLHFEVSSTGLWCISPNQERGFVAFMNALMTQDEALELEIDGHVDVLIDTAIGELNLTGIPLQTTLELDGLGGFRQNQIKSFKMDRSTKDKVALDIEMELENPTPITMHPGKLVFDILYRNTTIGTMTSRHATDYIRPGANILEFSGSLYSHAKHYTAAQDLVDLSEMMSNYLSGRSSSVTARSATQASSHALLNAGIQHLDIHTLVEAIPTSLISNVEFMTIALTAPEENLVQLKAISQITTDQVLGSSGRYQVLSVDMEMYMHSSPMYRTMTSGPTLGAVSAQGMIPLSGKDWSDDKIELVVEGPLEFINGKKGPMIEWITSYIGAQVIDLVIEGTCSVTVLLPGFDFPIRISDLPIDHQVSLAGMNKSGNAFPLDVTSFDLPHNSIEGVALDVVASFDHPGLAELNVGAITAELLYEGVVVGHMKLPEFALLRGTNVLHTSGEVSSDKSETTLLALERFFNQYLAHKDVLTHIRVVVPHASWLTNVFENVHLSCVISGMPEGRQVVTELGFDDSRVAIEIEMRDAGALPRFRGHLHTKMSIPFNFPIHLVEYGGNVTLEAAVVGTLGTLVLERRSCVQNSNSSSRSSSISISTNNCQLGLGEPLVLEMEATLDTAGYEAAFDIFVAELVESETELELRVHGSLSCSISTNLDLANGQRLVVKAPIDTALHTQKFQHKTSLSLPGFRRLAPITIHALEIGNGLPMALPITTSVTLCNPTTNVDLVASDLAFGIYFTNELVAVVHHQDSRDIVLPHDTCVTLDMVGAMNRSVPGFSEPASRLMFENYLTNVPSQVDIRGRASKSHALQNALQFVSLTSMVPPRQCTNGSGPINPRGCPLVDHTDLIELEFNSMSDFYNRYFRGDTFNLLKSSKVVMWIHNSFPDTQMYPSSYYIKIMYKDLVMGYIDEGPNNMTIPGLTTAGAHFQVKAINANQNDMERQFDMVCDLLNDRLYVDAGAGSSFGAKIGEYDIVTGYSQKQSKVHCQMNDHFRSLCDAVMANRGLFLKIGKAGCGFKTGLRSQYLDAMRTRRSSPKRWWRDN